MGQAAQGFDGAAPDMGIIRGQGFRELWYRRRGKPRESVQAIAAAHGVAKRFDERADRGLPHGSIPVRNRLPAPPAAAPATAGIGCPRLAVQRQRLRPPRRIGACRSSGLDQPVRPAPRRLPHGAPPVSSPGGAGRSECPPSARIAACAGRRIAVLPAQRYQSAPTARGVADRCRCASAAATADVRPRIAVSRTSRSACVTAGSSRSAVAGRGP